MAAALFLALAASCSDSDVPAPAPTASPPFPDATATPRPGVPVAHPDNIGVRGAVPQNDPIALAERYGLTDGRAARAKPFAGELEVGHRREFQVARLSGATLSGAAPPETVSVPATLLARSEHAYFFAEDVIGVDPADMEAAAEMFESSVWPRLTGVFGAPPAPGVDDDPRIIVLQANLGGGAGGYFSGDDVYLRVVRPQSNEAEMVYLDRSLRPGGAAFNVVLAHEFQHLIHHANDEDEESWVNEGLSEAAAGLVGGALSSLDAFALRPDTQLNHWQMEGSAPHYGAGASFFRYLAHRFGGDSALGELARADGDGQVGVDEFLADRGESLRFRDVFADWIVANMLARETGPYGNPERSAEPRITQDIRRDVTVQDEVNQFGADYYNLPSGSGDYVLRFDGAASTPVIPAVEDGDYAFWSNLGDDIDSRLTGEIDLSGSATAALTFSTWYDIEPWYDWGYVSVSSDGGDTWKALAGGHTTVFDPVEIALGPGYYGKSGGGERPEWVEERIDLTPYAGGKVHVRFEYVTDGGMHGDGWAIRDLALDRDETSRPLEPEWDADGWLRIEEPLEQTYAVRLIVQGTGDPSVVDVPIRRGRGELRFTLEPSEQANVVVAATTEGTTMPASYSIELLGR